MFVAKRNLLCLLRVHNFQGINDAITYIHHRISPKIKSNQKYSTMHEHWTPNIYTIHTGCNRYAWMVLKWFSSQMASKTKFSSNKGRTASASIFIHLANIIALYAWRILLSIFHVSCSNVQCYKTLNFRFTLKRFYIIIYYLSLMQNGMMKRVNISGSFYYRHRNSSLQFISLDAYIYWAQIILAYKIQENFK